MYYNFVNEVSRRILGTREFNTVFQPWLSPIRLSLTMDTNIQDLIDDIKDIEHSDWGDVVYTIYISRLEGTELSACKVRLFDN